VKCEINVQWRDGYEEVSVSREREAHEVLVDDELFETDWRRIQNAIDALDKTYADTRKALLAFLPEQVRGGMGVMVHMTANQAREYGQSA